MDSILPKPVQTRELMCFTGKTDINIKKTQINLRKCSSCNVGKKSRLAVIWSYTIVLCIVKEIETYSMHSYIFILLWYIVYHVAFRACCTATYAVINVTTCFSSMLAVAYGLGWITNHCVSLWMSNMFWSNTFSESLEAICQKITLGSPFTYER